ncbi:MAG: thiosulfate oxidation carrier protein SoxY [Gallionella sp.]|jgi:sulfur-oxidizing protein SoxY|nr:thiosulfate oxidation carrier protein SoxY [Gallionella sp.]MCK9352653.1 thiosulfate oxidation carrier protein SoxY [Gallionella sp.]
MEVGIDLERRKALKTGGGLGLLGLLAAVGLIQPGSALAEWQKSAFDAKTMDEALTALGVVVPESSAAIQLTAPDVAENGAVVPVTVESSLARTEQISILVDKNPTMLVSSFVIPEGTEGYLNTKIKMAQTATVIALVKADGKFYRVSREVKVTAGGC